MEDSDLGVVRRPELLSAGFSDDELRRLRVDGSLVPLRRGAYAAGGDPRLQHPLGRHVLAVEAAMQQVGHGAVVSHASAAVLHGLPLWHTALDRVHVTRNRCSGGRRSRFLHVHAAALEVDEVVRMRGLPVTSVARTLADLARALPLESALVPVDAALHRELVTPDELRAAVDRASSRRGNTAARRVVALADAGAESPGETRSRLAILRAGLPAPRLQRDVVSRTGRRIGRVDFDWAGFSTVGEFDGQVKYGRLLRPGQDPGEVVFAEKVREDSLRAEGLQVVRWIWAELADFAAVADRIRSAFARSAR